MIMVSVGVCSLAQMDAHAEKAYSSCIVSYPCLPTDSMILLHLATSSLPVTSSCLLARTLYALT